MIRFDRMTQRRVERALGEQQGESLSLFYNVSHCNKSFTPSQLNHHSNLMASANRRHRVFKLVKLHPEHPHKLHFKHLWYLSATCPKCNQPIGYWMGERWHDGVLEPPVRLKPRELVGFDRMTRTNSAGIYTMDGVDWVLGSAHQKPWQLGRKKVE